MMSLGDITHALVDDIKALKFGPPVSHVYNPLTYAADPHFEYIKRFGGPPKKIVLVGMNPGPWGMAQTGVPFGEIEAVRQWMGIEGRVEPPESIHPKRPVMGFTCRRREVSGKRLWGWAQSVLKTPQRFFDLFYVANYCPLIFFETDGRNRTPNLLRAAERKPLFVACDRALKRTVRLLQPEIVVGVGKFAAQRSAAALKETGLAVGAITHPSPANPRANRGWQPLIEQELHQLGIRLAGV